MLVVLGGTLHDSTTAQATASQHLSRLNLRAMCGHGAHAQGHAWQHPSCGSLHLRHLKVARTLQQQQLLREARCAVESHPELSTLDLQAPCKTCTPSPQHCCPMLSSTVGGREL
eukprot:3742537-Amphidinium_carterae.1